MEDRSHEVFVVATLFFVLAWVTVGLRCYCRGIMMKSWGHDDYYMVATLVTFTVYLSFQITAAVYGTGRHRWDLSDEDSRIALLFWYLCELLYVVSNCLLKLSVGYFYLRVTMQRWHIWCVHLLMLGTILFSAIYFFLVMLQCMPISDFWNNNPASSRCIPKAPTLGSTYALAAVNTAADWAFGTLPFFIVWDLEMKTRTKILVVSILAFAAIGSTGTIVRMFYIKTLMNGPDFLYATTDVAVWSTIEPGIGITAANTACLRPFFRSLAWRVELASPQRDRRDRSYYDTLSQQKRGKHRRGYRRSLSPSDLVPTEAGRDYQTEIQGPSGESTLPMITFTRPEPEITIAPNGQIMQTQTVTIEEHTVEAPPRLQLRDSFRNSFAHTTLLRLGTFRIPTTEPGK